MSMLPASWHRPPDAPALYVPKNDGRRLRLNALVAAGNVGGDAERDAVSAYLDDPDETTRELAAWALGRLEERDA